MLSTPSPRRASLLHKKAISAVHTLLCSHDTDPRYAEATVKARVAELYLPLLSLARDTLPRLHDFAGQRGWGSWSRVGKAGNTGPEGTGAAGEAQAPHRLCGASSLSRLRPHPGSGDSNGTVTPQSS